MVGGGSLDCEGDVSSSIACWDGENGVAEDSEGVGDEERARAGADFRRGADFVLLPVVDLLVDGRGGLNVGALRGLVGLAGTKGAILAVLMM